MGGMEIMTHVSHHIPRLLHSVYFSNLDGIRWNLHFNFFPITKLQIHPCLVLSCLAFDRLYFFGSDVSQLIV